jgi:cytochrome c-type biogenesis protein
VSDNTILRKSIVNTLFFILGFSIVFVSLGAGAGSFSFALQKYTRIISLVGGILVVIFSIQVLGVFNIPYLNYQRKALLSERPKGIVGAFIIGLTFAAAWTPCIGPILSSILILAAARETTLRGVLLLTAYSLGLGIPFLFAVFAYGYFISFSNFMKRNFKTIKVISGLLLLGIGVLLIVGGFERMSQYLSVLPDFTLFEAKNLSLFVAALAGFVSFISPCVLPMIPSYLTFVTGFAVTTVQPERIKKE